MYEAGRRSAEAEMAAAWARVTAVVRGPDLAEIEERRWGPGGRAHFGDARPGDFPGRPSHPKPSSNWRQGHEGAQALRQTPDPRATYGIPRHSMSMRLTRPRTMPTSGQVRGTAGSRGRGRARPGRPGSRSRGPGLGEAEG